MIENWKNTEHLGDCLEVMKGIQDKSIDFICTDLPFGTTQNKWDVIIPFEPLWRQYNRIIKDNGAIALFGMQPFTSEIISSNPDDFKYCWYWVKNRATGVLNAKIQPLRNIEEISIFNIKKYKPQGLVKYDKPSRNGKKDSSNYGKGKTNCYIQKWTNYPKQLLMFDCVQRPIHPTQKPVALIEYLIRTYSDENDIVLDSTAGSFTLAEACLNTNRNYIVIEKDPEEFKKGSNRIKEHKQKLAEWLF